MKQQQEKLPELAPEKKESLISTDSKKLSKKAARSLQQYRKTLLTQIVTIFLICLIVILERVFYQIIIEAQQKTLADFQVKLGLVKFGQDGALTPEGIKNNFLKFFGSLSEFPIQFLFLTHFLATIYVGFDSLIATKVIFVSLGSIYFISLLQLLYVGARPFWANQQIFSSSCIQSYNHPSLGLILLIFVPFYTYYCWKKKKNQVSSTPLKYIIAGVSIGILTFIVQFLNYSIGMIYIISIMMSVVISILLMLIVIAGNSVVDSAIKKSTILKTEAKKYSFYWLLVICLLSIVILIVYSGENLFLDIDWVDNFMRCTKYQNYSEKSYRYDQIIGPWFNFTQTSTLFAWVGAVFGISMAFRKISNVEWASGSTKTRTIRIALVNALIIPSWLFILLLQDSGNWIRDIGLNNFIVNSIHFFILYIWIFGYMPSIILHKWLKLTNREEDDFYVIVDETDYKV